MITIHTYSDRSTIVPSFANNRRRRPLSISYEQKNKLNITVAHPVATTKYRSYGKI